ncbi:MAG TPA: T9SS type A sorting domain-containing protein [Chitinophagales bacterium]|nr:T9SS type A sorting domain-containing protein [Chitinophagales bacterium]
MKSVFTLILLLHVCILMAQPKQTNWSITPEAQKVFIENKGQFDNLNNLPGSKILFGTESISNQILFTRNGLTYRLEERVGPTHEQREEREKEMREEIAKGKKISHQEMEERESRMIVRKDFVQMEWVNANPHVEVVALGTVNNYYNYGIGNKSIDHLNGYKKILYKNLYPNIDVEYVFHPKDGIEYNFILYPGADPSQIKMRYSDVSKIKTDKKGNLRYATMFGDIIEHAPKTFYEGTNTPIASNFVRNGKTISFQLGNYDNTKKVVIDPWVQQPTFATNWDCVWECERDAAGNVYIIGGVMPMQLLKYNPAGVLQWTYITPYDTSNAWLGTVATDNAGNSYVTRGSTAGLQKINTAGTLVWSTNGGGSLGNSDEYWSISFNCDQTKLVVGGTSGAFGLPPNLKAAIFDINTTNGSVTTDVTVAEGSTISFPPKVQEVRSITACGNGKYYFLTHDTIGYIHQNFSLCGPDGSFFKTPNSYGLSYKCEDFRVDNTGICAIKFHAGFVYTHRGDRLDKRDFATGAILTSVAIPGGAFSTGFGGSYVQNSGIDIDDCGNIYVGSKNQVVKFNSSLVQQTTYATTFNVYDVHVSTNGDIIACGSNFNSGSNQPRQGYIQSIAAGACAIPVLSCCDAAICSAGPVCTTAPAFALTPSTPGGVWSGPGVNPTTGLFTPATAGPGVHVIKNTLGCGSDSISITVNNCLPITACKETNGTYTASGGSGNYVWNKQVQQQDCSNCLLPAFCIPNGCATTVNAWQQFGTGSTVTPPGTFPLQIVDEYGTTLLIPNSGSLPNCSVTCSLTASATNSNTTCGNNNGGATVTATGGTPTGYAWSNGGTNASISNVAAGTYTVTVSAGACSATASAVVASSTGITASATSTNAGCASTGTATASISGGTASGYAWSGGGTTQSISNLAAGTYTVTVTSSAGCTATASTVVGSTGGIVVSSSANNATCGSSNGSATVTVTSGNATGYNWSSGATTATASNLAAGTYTVTVTGPGGCSATASAVVGNTGAPAITTSSINASCSSANGSATATVTSGTATAYSWSSGATTATASNLAAGTYTVTVTGTGGCTVTGSVVVNATGAPVITTSTTPAGCTGNTGSATATVTSGTATGYNWSSGSTTATASNLAAGTYTVTVTGSGGCSVTASVTVTATGGIAISASSTNTSCGNNNGTATVSVTQGNATTYNWSNGATSSSQTNLSAGTYTVTVSDAGGCTATASVIVGGSGAGNVTITSASTRMCVGDSIEVCAPAGYTSYLWNNGATTPCVQAKVAGNYRVTVTDNGNCTAASGPLAISVYQQPPVSISVNGDTLVAYNSLTYQWYRDGVIIDGATNPVYVPTQTGSYTVLVGDANGCTAQSLPVVITITGVEDLVKETLRIYPNPNADGQWNISVSQGWIGANCEVFDARGRLIHKSVITNERSLVDLNVASGVYVMNVTLGNKTLSQKLIKL